MEPQTPQQAVESIPTRQSSRHTNQMVNGTKYKGGNDRVRAKLHAFLEKLSADDVTTPRARDRSRSPTEAKAPQPSRKSSYLSIRHERQDLSDGDPAIIQGRKSAVVGDNSSKPTTAPAGSLPGVYHNFLLVRPDPSLHILFASSALQNTTDLRQTPLLSHISTSVNTLAGLREAF